MVAVAVEAGYVTTAEVATEVARVKVGWTWPTGQTVV
jgi:hypothetical protein